MSPSQTRHNKKRKEINRPRGNQRDIELREAMERLYKEQKMKTGELIKQEMTKYEEKLAQEIRENRNKTWENIEKLRKMIQREILQIYDEQGNKLSKEEGEKAVLSYWGMVYRMPDNKIPDVWNENIQKVYKEEMSKQHLDATEHEIIFPAHLREHS